MLIRTVRPCQVRGRDARAHACLDLPDAEAQALIDAGDAEVWVPVERARMPNAYLDAAEAAAAAAAAAKSKPAAKE